MEMLRKVKETIHKFGMLEGGEHVLVAVSGGVDSIVLLQVLYELKEELQLSLTVAHLDHQLRGEESRQDAIFVAKRAEELNLPIILKTFDVPSFIEEHRLSPEEGAREVRYKFLEEAAEKIKAKYIALGHNLNDQVETFLMRLLRGAGIEGLRGMLPVRGKFIRPLIECSREEIMKFAQERGLDFREDRTNIEPKYLRNRIRLELLPLLKEYNPNIFATIARTEEILRQAGSFLEKLAADKLAEVTISQEPGRLILRSRKAPEIIQEIMVRQAIFRVKGSLRGIGFAHLQAVCQAIKEDKGKIRIDLPGIIFERSGDNIIFAKSKRGRAAKKYNFPLEVPGENILKEIGWKFSFEILKGHDFLKAGNLEEYVDYAKIIKPVYVRNRREGDRFSPLGMKGTKKLKEFFIDEKVSRFKRDLIPLICDQNGIIWVVGYRLSERYKVASQTERMLKISATRLAEEER